MKRNGLMRKRKNRRNNFFSGPKLSYFWIKFWQKKTRLWFLEIQIVKAWNGQQSALNGTAIKNWQNWGIDWI